MSHALGVQADSTGEWGGGAVSFATKADAMAYIHSCLYVMIHYSFHEDARILQELQTVSIVQDRYLHSNVMRTRAWAGRRCAVVSARTAARSSGKPGMGLLKLLGRSPFQAPPFFGPCHS